MAGKFAQSHNKASAPAAFPPELLVGLEDSGRPGLSRAFLDTHTHIHTCLGLAQHIPDLLGRPRLALPFLGLAWLLVAPPGQPTHTPAGLVCLAGPLEPLLGLKHRIFPNFLLLTRRSSSLFELTLKAASCVRISGAPQCTRRGVGRNVDRGGSREQGAPPAQPGSLPVSDLLCISVCY